MATKGTVDGPAPAIPEATATRESQRQLNTIRWKKFLGTSKKGADTDSVDEYKNRREKWTLGILNDKETDEVPGKCYFARSDV